MQKIILSIGALSGAIAVGLGAFGAHAFKAVLESNQRVATFETGVKYHFIHTLALFVVAFLLDKYPAKYLGYSSIAFSAGIVLFSGSLYILSLTGNTKWGAVAPVGGAAFLVGWLLILYAVIKS